MPRQNPRIPAIALSEGMYFKDRATWYRALGSPEASPNATNDWLHVRVRHRSGAITGHVLYGGGVEVSPGNVRPSTWQPDALLREAHRLESKAEDLLRTVESLREHAREAREESRQIP